MYVVNKDNLEQFVEDFTAEHGEFAVVALSIDNYENLALNIADLRRYINQQTDIIVYYENAMKAPEEKTDGNDQ